MNQKGLPVLYRSIALCIAGNFLSLISSQATSIMLGFYLSYISSHLHAVSAIEVGLIGTGYRIAEFMGDPVMGAMSDFKGRKPLMILGPLISAAVVFLYPTTSSLVAIFTLLAFEGIGAAMRAPATLSFLSDATSTSDKLRGRTMSMHQITILCSIVIGYVFGGLLWNVGGLDAFRIVTVIYALGIVIISAGVEEQIKLSRQRLQEVRTYLGIISSPSTLRFLPAWISLSAVLGAWLSQTAFQLSSRPTQSDQALVGNFSSVQIGLILSAFALVFAGGTLAWGLLIGKLNKATIMLFATIGGYISFIALLIINHVGLASESGSSLLLVIAGVSLASGVFIQSGFTPAALAYLADLSEEHLAERGAIIGTYYVFLSIGQLVGAWLGGVSAEIAQLDGLAILSLGLVSIGFLDLLLILLANRRQLGQSSRRLQAGL